MKIAYSVIPENIPSQEEWMKEFRVGIVAPKPTNNRAKDMMEMWSGPTEPYNIFQSFLNLITFN